MLIPTCIIKLLELTLAVACLALHHYCFDLTDVPTLMLCSGTYIGFVIILTGEIIGEAVSASADAYVDAWWSAAGAALFAACGGLTLHAWRDIPACTRRNHAQAAAVCALALAVLMFVDSVVALCSARKESSSVRTKSVRTCNPCN